MPRSQELPACAVLIRVQSKLSNCSVSPWNFKVKLVLELSSFRWRLLLTKMDSGPTMTNLEWLKTPCLRLERPLV